MAEKRKVPVIDILDEGLQTFAAASLGFVFVVTLLSGIAGVIGMAILTWRTLLN